MEVIMRVLWVVCAACLLVVPAWAQTPAPGYAAVVNGDDELVTVGAFVAPDQIVTSASVLEYHTGLAIEVFGSDLTATVTSVSVHPNRVATCSDEQCGTNDLALVTLDQSLSVELVPVANPTDIFTYFTTTSFHHTFLDWLTGALLTVPWDRGGFGPPQCDPSHSGTTRLEPGLVFDEDGAILGTVTSNGTLVFTRDVWPFGSIDPFAPPLPSQTLADVVAGQYFGAAYCAPPPPPTCEDLLADAEDRADCGVVLFELALTDSVFTEPAADGDLLSGDVYVIDGSTVSDPAEIATCIDTLYPGAAVEVRSPPQGCSPDDIACQCPCGSAGNHGMYVTCFVKAASDLRASGYDDEALDHLVSEAGQAKECKMDKEASP
jgi:hypothetical protein